MSNVEMIDNPLNDKSKQRIHSFSEKRGSPGVTLGLILKEYSEFKVFKLSLYIMLLYLLYNY